MDIRGYVNPGFDESYNENLYTGWRWRRVKTILETEVCPRLAETAGQARWARYRLADRPSRAEIIIEQHLAERRKERRREQSIRTVCPVELARLLEPPAELHLSAR